MNRREFLGTAAAFAVLGLRAEAVAALTPRQRAKQAFDAYVRAYWDEGRSQFRKHKTGEEMLDFWFSAHAFDMLIDAHRFFGTTGTSKLARSYYDGFMKRFPDWTKNDFNDDILWWTISCLRAARHLRDAKYLKQARTMFDYLLEHELDDTLGGGMWWKNNEHKSKNACDNFPAVITACELYRLTRDQKYRKAAFGIYTWAREKMFHAESGAIRDSVNLKGEICPWYFSYNNGTFIGSALRLYRLTDKPEYLADAVKAAHFITDQKSPDGVMQGCGQGDGGAFNGIGMRYLWELSHASAGQWIKPYIAKNAEVMWANRRPSDNLVGPDWHKTIDDNFDLEGQTANSAVTSLVLAAF